MMQNIPDATVPALPIGLTEPHERRRRVNRTRQLSPVVIGGAVRAAELATLVALGALIAALYVDAAPVVVAAYAAAAAVTAVTASGLFQMLGLFEVAVGHRLVRSLTRVVAGWTLALAALMTLVFFAKLGDAFSRVWLATWYASGLAGLIGGRLILHALVNHWSRTGHLVRRAVVYGHGRGCQQFLSALGANASIGIRVCGIFDDRGNPRDEGSEPGARSGRLDDLVAFVQANNIDLIVLALPISAEGRLIDLLKRLWVLPADIRLVAGASRLRLSQRAYTEIGGVAMIPLTEKPISDWGIVGKWLFDKVIGTAALVALCPVMLATAIAIQIDSRGPVLFRQKRYGFNNELIEVFKFRSMYVDQTDVAAARLVTRDDPRVTRVGRFIRRTSLDELPQLFNVLIGNLSLVGPRPHAVSAKAAGKQYDEAIESYFARHRVKPGITGWAQINGWRGETDTEDKLRQRVEHDLHYIENWSVLFDAWILASTPLALLKTDNAY